MATTIYLSSTYDDLKEYRRTVCETLRKTGYQVIATEDHVARDQRPVDQCLQDVEKADIYVGIFAFRYGYIPPPHDRNPDSLSITELEFRHAVNLKKPCLIYMAKRETGIPLTFVDVYTGDGDHGHKIEALRQYLVRERVVDTFSAPHELAILLPLQLRPPLRQGPRVDQGGGDGIRLNRTD